MESDDLSVGSVRSWHCHLQRVETETGREGRRKGERRMSPVDSSNPADRVSCLARNMFDANLSEGLD